MDQQTTAAPISTAKTKRFSIKEAIRYGWGTAKSKFAFFAGVVIISGVFSMLSSSVSSTIDKTHDPAKLGVLFVVYVILALLGMVVSLGFIHISLKVYDGKDVEIGDLFSQYMLVANYFLSAILYSLIVLGGLILLVVPGFIFAVKYQFFPYFIVEGSGPIEALKKSGALTGGEKWHLFWSYILLGLINIAGFLVIFIGLLWTIPTVMLAMAFVYRKLQGQGAPIVSAPVTPISNSVA